MPLVISEDPPQRVVVEYNGPVLHAGEVEILDLMMTPAQAETYVQLLKQHNSMAMADGKINPVKWTRYAVNTKVALGRNGNALIKECFWDILESQ